MSEETDSADGTLLAYVDGVLSPAEREALEARLASEPDLRERLKKLAAGGRRFGEAYDVLLRNAPRERLTAALDRARAGFAAAEAEKRRTPTRRWRRPLAAAVALFVAGAAVGLGVGHFAVDSQIARDQSETGAGNWRDAVAEYLSLYTRDTLANLPDDLSLRETELKSVGDKLALPLSVEQVKLDGLLLKRSQLYDLDGRALAQIAYLAPDDGPVAFCIIASDQGDRPPNFEERQGKNIVYWSKAGHAFMLIGDLPRSRLETLAASLAARVA
jgi:anti-sigma factor RsiW